jgi:hypothetical protein
MASLLLHDSWVQLYVLYVAVLTERPIGGRRGVKGQRCRGDGRILGNVGSSPSRTGTAPQQEMLSQSSTTTVYGEEPHYLGARIDPKRGQGRKLTPDFGAGQTFRRKTRWD